MHKNELAFKLYISLLFPEKIEKREKKILFLEILKIKLKKEKNGWAPTVILWA